MASALPLLLVGGAALLLMSKKKAPAAAAALRPLPSTATYPPPGGEVCEPLNAVQFPIATQSSDQPGIHLTYEPDNAFSVASRTAFGHIAKANPDVVFTAAPLSFLEYMFEVNPEEYAEAGKIVDMLKSGTFAVAIDSVGHDAGVQDSPARFAEEMVLALKATRAEIAQRAQD